MTETLSNMFYETKLKNGETVFKCVICKAFFFSIKDANRHIDYHINEPSSNVIRIKKKRRIY